MECTCGADKEVCVDCMQAEIKRLKQMIDTQDRINAALEEENDKLGAENAKLKSLLNKQDVKCT